MKIYLICCGLGYMAAQLVVATAFIQAAIMRAAERNRFPKYLRVAFKYANGLATLGAFLSWGELVGSFLRSCGDLCRFALVITLAFGMGVAFFAIRELDGLRKTNDTRPRPSIK